MEEIKIVPLLKASDVARLLAISRTSAYRLLRDGLIPSITFGHEMVRVRLSDLQDFIERNRREGGGK